MRHIALVSALVLAAALASAQTRSASKFTPAMAERPDVKQALAYVDAHFDAQVAEWIALTEIPALSTHEQKRAAYIKGELEKLGLKPTDRRPRQRHGAARRHGRRADRALRGAHGHRPSDGHRPDGQAAARRHASRAGRLRRHGVATSTCCRRCGRSTRPRSARRATSSPSSPCRRKLGLKGMYYWFDHNPKAADMIVGIDGELGAVNYGALGIYWSKMKFTAAGAHTNNSRDQPHPARAAAQCITRHLHDSAAAGQRRRAGASTTSACSVAAPSSTPSHRRHGSPSICGRSIRRCSRSLDAQIVAKCEQAASTRRT